MKDDRSYKQELSASDIDFIRVLEDLIDVLISNGTIRMTDLPPEALKKLHARKQTRERLRNTSLDLINDDDGLL